MPNIDVIKGRHAKASDEDYFSKFVFEYLAFIAFLRTYKYENASNDRDAIQKLKQDVNIKQMYLEKMNKQIKKSRQILIKEFQENGRLGNVSNLRTTEEIKRWNHICNSDSFCNQNGCDTNINLLEFTENNKGIIYGIDDWGNMVEFWRTIRDNLFHGAKDPERRRDKLVVEHGYKTLSLLMEILLRS